MKFSLTNRQKPKQFNPKPRYWDPEKEEKEARKQRYERLANTETGYSPEAFKQELQYRWGLNRPSQHKFNQKNTSGKRFLIILSILILLIYTIYLLGK